MPMETEAPAKAEESLALQFSRLWSNELACPDVFTFLSSHPDINDDLRLDVLLIDQRERWSRRKSLPLRVYLSAFPEIAARGEMVRALVDGDRAERRRKSGVLGDTLNPNTLDVVSETPTQPIEGDAAPDDTQVEDGGGEAAVTVDRGLEPTGLRSTRNPSNVNATEENLSFDLDEAYHLQSEAATLRAMLNTVRFTLVRRLGAGGMGVVYETYDQQRGELVALKTMRRVDAGALVRFKQEFRSLSDITHPNLVNLYELFAVEDRWFFTMELVEGCNFLSYVQGSPEEASDRWNAAPTVMARPARSPVGTSTATRMPNFHFDDKRLREALAQLALGVSALHQAGKLHRDIKPPNVLVTLEGRVVLLDFGLTADLESVGTERQVVGTIGHMSPEQAAGKSVSTASDWYSVGVMLFEAMTGRLPFAGTPEDVLAAKQQQAAPSPDTLVEGLPPDLVRLCVALLDRDVTKRPSGRDVIAGLSGQVPAPLDQSEPVRAFPLIGRSRHRRVLDSGLAALHRRKTVSLFVFGRTGTGKTTLVRSFLDELLEREEAVVLSGRCYERESVPYKALDSLIDSLARYLKGLPAEQAASLLPEDVGFLARAFPVLQSLEPIAAARRLSPEEMPDQQELRRRIFGGLRELLKRLAERTPLILAIDDLQWGDVDSARLLSELICSDRSPAFLFIGCFRSEDSEHNPFLLEMRRAIAKDANTLDHRELAVEELAMTEARQLSLALLGRDDAVALAQAHMVATESGGNPLFIDELVRHIQSGEPIERWEAIGKLDLDEVLWTRIKRQPEDALRLLGLVAVSGRPIRQSLAFQASELGAGARVALASLRSARLIRCLGQAHNEEVEIYHDRIRETVVAHLPSESVRWNHERLALVLLTSGSVDPEILAVHYRGAGQTVRACEYYSLAADQAAAALAFEHSARLYRFALELHQGTPAQAGVLWRKLGDALANAGRGNEAAQVYAKAAETATAADTLELKRLASTQLLLSGHVEDGLALLRTLLGPLGLSMPKTARQAWMSLFRHRLLLKLHGLKFRRRDESQISAIELARIDLCWSAVAGLSMSEPIRGADFQTRGLLLALRAGEPLRIARALAMEAGHRATAGAPAAARVASLLAQAEKIAQEIDSPYARGMIEMVRGFASLMRGEWQTARTVLEGAEQVFRQHCTGVTWERDTIHNFLLRALVQMGEIRELHARWSVFFRESQERGDRYAGTMLSSFYMTMIKLAGNQQPESEGELEAELEGSEVESFNLRHSNAFEALIHLYLYRSDVSRALIRFETIWPRYEKSMLLRIRMTRIDLLEMRARCALAMAEKPGEPEAYLRQAADDALRLEKEGHKWASAHALYIRSGIAACREDPVRAVEYLLKSADCYDEVQMPLRSQLLRYRLGEIHGGPDSRAQHDRAEQWIKSQGIVAPARWAGMYAPGFAKIAGNSIETTY
jgi:eukaryotic-like serine/threonine-protein kinase